MKSLILVRKNYFGLSGYSTLVCYLGLLELIKLIKIKDFSLFRNVNDSK